MADEPYTTRRETSPQGSKPSTNQRLAYATQRAEVLFGCYRRGDANDPDRYVAAIAAVLSSYDFEIIREVTDPRTGIGATEKFMTFMPNAGELKVYCDAVAAQRARIQRLGEMPRPDFSRALLTPPPRLPGDLATVLIPIGHHRYADLAEWSKTADPRLWRFDNRGIWISWCTWDKRAVGAKRLGEITEPIIEQAANPPMSINSTIPDGLENQHEAAAE